MRKQKIYLIIALTCFAAIHKCKAATCEHLQTQYAILYNSGYKKQAQGVKKTNN